MTKQSDCGELPYSLWNCVVLQLLSTEKSKHAPFWTFEYYQTFFNVDTQEVSSPLKTARIVQHSKSSFWYEGYYFVHLLWPLCCQVKERIFASILPWRGKNFVHLHIRNNPDLYGEWVCDTRRCCICLCVCFSADISNATNILLYLSIWSQGCVTGLRGYST